MTKTKWCNRCKTRKPLSEFGKNKLTRTGCSVYCALCSREYQKEWAHRPENKKKLKDKRSTPEYKKYKDEYDRKRLKTIPHRMWATRSLKYHRQSGYDVTLTIDELEKMAINTEICPFCGTVLEWNVGKGVSRASPTLDRTHNGDTVDRDNVMIICYRCNTSKSDRSLEGFTDYCKGIVERFGG